MTFVLVYFWVVYVAGGVSLLAKERPLDKIGTMALVFAALSLALCWNPITDLLSFIFAGLATMVLALHIVAVNRKDQSKVRTWCCGGIACAVLAGVLNGPLPTFIVQ